MQTLAHHAHTMRTPCAHHAHTMRTPCAHHAHTMRTHLQAGALLAFSEGKTNQVDLVEGKLCGTPCQDLVDSAGTAVCASTWREGCGEEAPPPAGFSADASVAELCSLSCAWYTFQHSGLP
jgi:hypothetical protein